MSTELSCLRVRLPAGATAKARKQLAPYLIHEAPWSAVEALGGDRRGLSLHPRIRTLAQLPEPLREELARLGGEWDTRALGLLTPPERARLFTVVFFSKSKPGPALAPGLPPTWRRVLSNFHRAELRVDGHPYASVEHYFQGQKALCSTRPHMAEWFRRDAELPEAVDDAPAAAKRAGGRKAYGQADARLDTSAWLEARIPAMARALEARWRQQPEFRAVLESTVGLDLLHFERSGARSFWGGSLARETGLPHGENQLGRMLMSLRER